MRFVVVSLVLAHSLSAYAFLNIESLRQSFKDGFSGSSGVHTSGASGNRDIFEVGGNSRNIYKHRSREYIFITEYKYGEASGLKNSHQGNGHIRYAQRFSGSWQWEAFSQIEFNEFQSLKLRSLLGGGLRYQIFNKDTSQMYFGMGLFYEDETLKDSPDQSNFRGNLYLSWVKSVLEKAELVIVGYYQPSFKSVKDERLQFSFGFEIEILNNFSLANSFKYARDSRPPNRIETEDLSYKVGVNLSY